MDTKASTYLGILQGVIGRMAERSSNCKTWCVTVVSALLAIAVERQSNDTAIIALVPVGLFFYLDSYYLSLERDYIQIFNGFAEKLRTAAVSDADLFLLSPPRGFFTRTRKIFLAGLWSPSTLPVYGILGAVVSCAVYWI